MTSLLVEATRAPLTLDLILARAAHQHALRVAAKLAVWPEGAGILAEIVRTGDLSLETARATAALAAAAAWCAGSTTAGGAPDALRDLERHGDGEVARQHSDGTHGDGVRMRAALAEALAVLGWTTLESGPGSYRVQGLPDSALRRLTIEVTGPGTIRVAVPPLPIRVAGAAGVRAVQLFALTASARIRLARVSAAPLAPSVVGVTRDAIVHGNVDPERLATVLALARQALVAATAFTARPFRALATAPVAAAFLESHSSLIADTPPTAQSA